MRLTILIALPAAATAAHAHVGDHTHLPISGILTHLLEAGHLSLAILAIGVTAFGGFQALRRRAATVETDNRS